MSIIAVDYGTIEGGYSKGTLKEFSNVIYGTGQTITCDFTPKVVITRTKLTGSNVYGCGYLSEDVSLQGGKWANASGSTYEYSRISITGNSVYVDTFSSNWDTGNTMQVAILGD